MLIVGGHGLGSRLNKKESWVAASVPLCFLTVDVSCFSHHDFPTMMDCIPSNCKPSKPFHPQLPSSATLSQPQENSSRCPLNNELVEKAIGKFWIHSPGPRGSISHGILLASEPFPTGLYFECLFPSWRCYLGGCVTFQGPSAQRRSLEWNFQGYYTQPLVPVLGFLLPGLLPGGSSLCHVPTAREQQYKNMHLL